MSILHPRRSALLATAFLLGAVSLWAMHIQQQNTANYALVASIHNNDTKGVVDALRRGADPNASEARPLSLTGWERGKRLFQGQNPFRDKGQPALLLALEGRHPKNAHYPFSTQDKPPENIGIVKALLEAGADGAAETSAGHTPLYAAIYSSKWEAVRLLLRHNAPVNTKDEWGYTPLNLAVPNAEVDIIREMLRRGAQVNMPSIQKPRSASFLECVASPALFNAVRGGDASVVALLLQAGADVHQKGENYTDNWQTPWQAALERREFYSENAKERREAEEITSLLREAGGKQ
jgi:hypothetical protein